MNRFEGKAVIVTGAGAGIGAGTACRFLQEGASVVLNGRREHKPPDQHALTIEVEPSIAPAEETALTAGDETGIAPGLEIPGREVLAPTTRTAPHTRPTDFGDMTETRHAPIPASPSRFRSAGRGWPSISKRFPCFFWRSVLRWWPAFSSRPKWKRGRGRLPCRQGGPPGAGGAAGQGDRHRVLAGFTVTVVCLSLA